MKNKDTARILIVDDQIHALQGVSRIMRGAGYETFEASNGTDCLNLAAEHKPDLILLDVVLPDIDGREVCRRIKSDPETADSYVVLFSSVHIESDSQAEGLEHGADGYIARPIPNRELLARVKAILRLKFAESRLRESEERYRRISSLTSDIAYSCIKSNNTVYSIDWITGAVERITGHSEEDIKALGCWRTLVIDEDRAIFDTKVVGIAPGYTGSCELRLCHKSGKIVWVSSLAECVLASGTPDSLRLYGGLVDITERKTNEETLRQSEDKFSKAFFLSPDAIAITRLVDGAYVAVNEGFKGILGYTEEEVIGKTSLELNVWVNPEDRQKVIDALKAEGKVDNFEACFRTKTGDIRYGLISVSIIELHGVPHILNIARDITDRKRAAEELRISEDKFSKAFHLNPDAILITRLVDGMIVTVNEGFTQIFGAREEEVIGKTAMELNIWLNPEDRNRVIEGLKTEGKVNNFEFSFRTKYGDNRYGLISASIISLDGVAHALSITRDITESKIAREQLFQSQKMEAIGTLAGGFAHDLNNKLQIIKGYLDLILFNKDLPETIKTDLEVMTQAVDSSADLIKGLMVFSRKTPVELQPMGLNKLIASICSMLAHAIPKTIDIDIVAGDDLWAIIAVPNQIDQILMNLAINARDAMPDGGKLTMKTQNITLDEEYCRIDPVAKPGRYVLIEVSDTGTGMDKETVSHIFEPFFTTKEAGKGTGLGLSVVYGIVEQHGGRIVCDSEPSVGTTFKIYFPAIEDLAE
jgi:PAS domain S-box-containing protein